MVALVAVMAVATGCAGEDTSEAGEPSAPEAVASSAASSSINPDVAATTTTATAPARTPLPGFDVVAVRVIDATGAIVEGCVLLADDAASRSRGLMEVTDPTLGGYDGMLFTFDVATTASFYMLNTPLPLTVAFFDNDRFVSARDMVPCPDDDDDPRCPRYSADAPYTQALEVPAGRLPALGVGPGSRLEVGGACGALRTG